MKSLLPKALSLCLGLASLGCQSCQHSSSDNAASTPAQTTTTDVAELALTPVEAGALKARLSARGSPTLLNMWSTWCAPCIAELPDLLLLRKELAGTGFELVLFSADAEEERAEALKVLREAGVDFETFVRDQSDEDFINAIDPKWGGTLPYSLLLMPGQPTARFSGTLSIPDLKRRIQHATP